MRPFKGASAGGKSGTWWPWSLSNSTGKIGQPSTASLLLTSFTISSPSDSLRWTPNTSASFSLSAPPVGGLSRLIGLSGCRRYILLRLFDLGYALRLRLPLLISAGFFLCHLFSIYFPRIEINVEVVEEEEDDFEDEEQVEEEVEIDTEGEEEVEEEHSQNN